MGKAESRPIEAMPRRRAAEPPGPEAHATCLPASDTGSWRLLQELQLQRIELELQNAALTRSRDEMEMELARYTDLYECAPVGYLTLQRDGAIAGANLTGAGLLGVERARLLGRRFGEFLAETGRSAFTAFLGNVFTGRGKEVCELALLDGEGRQLYAQLEGVIAASGEECRVALIDLTGRRKSEDALTAKILLAEERERRRIAGELHDQIGQTLAFAKIKLDVLGHQLAGAPFFALPAIGHARTVGEIMKAIETCIQEVRTLTFQISPPLLYELGFEAAIDWLCEWALEHHGLEVQFLDDGQAKPLDEEARSTLFQAVRELLINTAKHAQTGKAAISIRKSGTKLILEVSDPGIGFDVTRVGVRKENSSGFGLLNIRQRVGFLGGEFYLESKPGKGSQFTLVVPLSAPAPQG